MPKTEQEEQDDVSLSTIASYKLEITVKATFLHFIVEDFNATVPLRLSCN